MGADYHPQRKPPTQQPDVADAQANPVSGTQYPIIAATANVRIITISVNCTWTVQPTDLEIHATIDGVLWSFVQANPVNNRWYIAQVVAYALETAQGMADSGVADPSSQRAFLIEGRNIAVAAEVTGGTVQNLAWRLRHAVY